MGMSFKKLMQENREKKDKPSSSTGSATGSQGKSSQKKSRDTLLYGSGFTKREAERAEKDFVKKQESEYKLESADDSDNEPVLINAELPTDLLAEGITLDKYQQAAVEGLRNQKYGCLIGAAGTGKTTAVKTLVKELEKTVGVIDINAARTVNNRSEKEEYNVPICFVSFTGKAVQQMKRALPKEYHPLCNTIHATLGYAPVEEEMFDENTEEYVSRKVFRPSFTKYNKLPYKICIVDEAGTVPIYLWNELLDALPDDARVILIGDINQLPPVQGRSVLGFAMLSWPTFTLEKIHRQAEDNVIIYNAHRIITGKKPVKQENNKDFYLLEIADDPLVAFNQSINIIKKMYNADKFDPLRDAFIVPQNIRTLGQEHYNEKLVRFFNPVKKRDEIPINPPVIIQAGYHNVVFAVGDKVMLTANDTQRGLTNGMIGVVTSIVPNDKFKGQQQADQTLSDLESGEIDLSDLAGEISNLAINDEKDDEKESERQASHIMRIKIQNREEEIELFTAGQFKKVVHSYAMTCHKAQGSEYHTVVILVHSENIRMLSREWLYTAVTRAKSRVIILHNRRGLTHAVNRQIIRGSTIEEKAKAFLQLQSKEDTILPNLPESQEI